MTEEIRPSGQESQEPHRPLDEQEPAAPQEAPVPASAAAPPQTAGHAVRPEDGERTPPIRLVNRREGEEGAPGEVDALVAMYVESLKNLEEGEVLKGRILKVDEKDVLVDIGFKSEGIIALEEFGEVESVKVGDIIDVFLERIEDEHGLIVLSKQRADFVKVWDRVKDAAEKGEVVEGRLVKKIKGGVVVDLFGVEAFLPGSQVALRQPQSIESLMSQTLQFKIIKLNKRRRNIVVSRRLVLEEEREKAKATILKELSVEQIREGYVKNITDFGAFIDLGGIDGLLHITDMSWGRIRHPSEVLSVGDKVKVKVLSFDPERERISLGIKQLSEYPWQRVDEKYPVGSKVHGRVVSITEYGAFVELENGVEGLIHISEMSWTKHIRHPSKILREGQELECMVLKVDKENERISLGLKQVEPDPWLTLDEKYPAGMRVRGKVRNLTNFGAFVELEEGIDGLVHVSDMSWTKRVAHPNEVLKKGDTVEVVILSIDKEHRRISLGLKQVEPDPWLTLDERYPVNSIVTGKVRNLTNFGAFVELEDGIDGLVHISDMSWTRRIGHPSEILRKSDTVTVRVLSLDKVNRRVSLGLKQVQEDPWPLLIERYPINSEARGRVAKVIDRGAVVMLEDDVEGFVPAGQLGIEDLPDPRHCFREGDEIQLRITRVDPANRRILLSVKAWLAEQEPAVVEEYVKKYAARAAAEGAAAERAAAEAQTPEESPAGAEEDAPPPEESFGEPAPAGQAEPQGTLSEGETPAADAGTGGENPETAV